MLEFLYLRRVQLSKVYDTSASCYKRLVFKGLRFCICAKKKNAYYNKDFELKSTTFKNCDLYTYIFKLLFFHHRFTGHYRFDYQQNL